GRNSAGELVLGLHSPGNFAIVIDIQECFLHPPEFNTVLKVVREFVRSLQLKPYDPTTHQGLLRHLVIRYSHTTKKVLVVLITAKAEPAELKQLPGIIKQQVPNLSGFIWGVSTKLADVAQIETVVYEEGEVFLLEQLGDLKFQVSAFSFFQTNTPGAERLYSVVKDFTELTGREVLIDAYCGTGTIGIFCADRARKVYGIELLPQAVWDARRNAQLNNYSHCVFLVGDIPRTIALLNQILKQPVGRIIVDPPRSGLDKKSVRALLSLEAELVVYVSCNPTTLARDLQFFTEAGYELTKVQPVDMFPHTFHIETVAQLKKPKNIT
ncbi:MAG: 23S rRNA (uracil(1939)-C(5))-methyltransferase RlmD, partial [Candidatus Sumerlaeia bacterium]|nr:23S rRNA (uracil(1939)-C(5))-methyltransferase RlmD [Candidatus Sumerlaeia bacterium]